jgi:hypothetical protein
MSEKEKIENSGKLVLPSRYENMVRGRRGGGGGKGRISMMMGYVAVRAFKI